MHTYILLILFGFHAQAKLCKPDISEGIYSNLTVGGHTSLECELYNCDNVDKVVFEKTNVVNSTTWTPVFEEINITYYQAIDTGNNLYSLNNRNEYHAFRKQRILYISSLTVKDQGKWRCVIYDQTNGSAMSQNLHLFFEKHCNMDMSKGIYSNLTVGGHTSLECELYNCDNADRVVFEKTHVVNSTSWTPVFEEINATNYHIIDTGNKLYSLNNRNEYHAFRKQRILYISPLTDADQGKWRCVGHDTTTRRVASPTVRLFFRSTFKPKKTRTKKENIEKMECVSIDWVLSPLTESTCSADRINSEPESASIFNMVEQNKEAEKLSGEIVVIQLFCTLVYIVGMYTVLGWSWYRTIRKHHKGSGMKEHKTILIPTQTYPRGGDVVDYIAQTENYILVNRGTQSEYVALPDKQFTDSDIYNDSGYSTGSSIHLRRKNPIHNTTKTDSVDVQNSHTQTENNDTPNPIHNSTKTDSVDVQNCHTQTENNDTPNPIRNSTKIDSVDVQNSHTKTENNDTPNPIHNSTKTDSVDVQNSHTQTENNDTLNPIHNSTKIDSVDVQNSQTQTENNNTADIGIKDHVATLTDSLSTHKFYDSGFSTSSGSYTRSKILIDEHTNRDAQDCKTQNWDYSMMDSGIQTDFVSLMDSTIHISSGEIKHVDIQTDNKHDIHQNWTSHIACSTEAIENMQRTMTQISETIQTDTDGSNTNIKQSNANIQQQLNDCEISLRGIQLSVGNVERPESTYDKKVKAEKSTKNLIDPIETDKTADEFKFEDHLGMFGDSLTTEKWKNQFEELEDKKTREKAIEVFLKMSMNEKLTLVNGFEMKSNELKAGDMIKVNGEETFEQLQQGFGGYEPEMASILNETGIVDRKILHVFSVTFDSGKRYLLNGQNLTRITKDEYDNRVTQNVCTKAEPEVSLQEGDLVQLLRDTESVRTRLGKMKGVGWNHEMKECLGLPGIVFGVRDNGSANVRFINGNMWVMSPDVLTKLDLEDDILEEGDLVMVSMKKEALETWQREIGEWHTDTSKKSGKFGILRRMEETENSVQVEIGGKVFIFNKQAIRLVAKKGQIQQRDEGKIGYLSK